MKIHLQYCIPQNLFSTLWGFFANLTRPQWFKNWAIHHFIKKYHVNMHEAVYSAPQEYNNFNHFFTRRLKPNTRPIGTDIISPVDGIISECGPIDHTTLIQAKGRYFDLKELLGSAYHESDFENGHYATLYLAPHNYHRVHMPCAGTLSQSVFIPGKLFSVNIKTTEKIPKLFCQNKRVINLIETEHMGKMAIILVGAIIVGNIVMLAKPAQRLEKGQELGYFELGSTVIVLFEKNKMRFHEHLLATNREKSEKSEIKMGQSIGSLYYATA